jgi:hypothetical protein
MGFTGINMEILITNALAILIKARMAINLTNFSSTNNFGNMKFDDWSNQSRSNGTINVRNVE